MTKHSTTSSATSPSTDTMHQSMTDVEKGFTKKKQKKESRPIPHTPDYESKYGVYSAGTCYDRPKVSGKWETQEM
jgi:hypothetical protein